MSDKLKLLFFNVVCIGYFLSLEKTLRGYTVGQCSWSTITKATFVSAVDYPSEGPSQADCHSELGCMDPDSSKLLCFSHKQQTKAGEVDYFSILATYTCLHLPCTEVAAPKC